MVLEYLEWKASYDRDKLVRDFGKSNFLVRGLTIDDISDSLVRAAALLTNYRGKIAKDNRIMTYILGGAGAFTFLVAVLVGFFAESWFWCMFLVILYILGLFLA